MDGKPWHEKHEGRTPIAKACRSYIHDHQDHAAEYWSRNQIICISYEDNRLGVGVQLRSEDIVMTS